MSIAKRVTYLKGLTEGLNLGNDTKEEKILRVMIEVLADMSAEIEELIEDVKVLDEDVSALVEDVEELAEEMDELVEDMDELEEALGEVEASGDCCCDSNDHSHVSAAPVVVASAPPSGRPSGRAGRANGKSVKQPQFFEVECPHCQNEITIDEDVLGLGVIDCPNCGERLELEE